MDHWAKRIKELEQISQELHRLEPEKFECVVGQLLVKYVDDCLVALKKLRLGSIWSPADKAMMWSEEAMQQDIDKGVTRETLTMEHYSRMAGSIMGFLSFTWDHPDNNPSGAMPVLDTEMWMGQEERVMGVPKEILDREIPEIKGELTRVILMKFYT